MTAAPADLAQVLALHPSVPLAGTQGTLALDLEPCLLPPAAPDPDAEDEHCDAEVWARRFVQAAAEIVGGDRPPSQLVRWASREVYSDLERRANLVARAGGHHPGAARVQPIRPRVMSLRCCALNDDVIEAAARLRYGQRSRAAALRFERRHSHDGARWVCTALEWA